MASHWSQSFSVLNDGFLFSVKPGMASKILNLNRWYVVTADAIFLGGRIYRQGDWISSHDIPPKLEDLLSRSLRQIKHDERQAA